MGEDNRNEQVNCVECTNCEPKLLKAQGRTRTLLPNGQWSETTICDVYEIICKEDGKTKGKVFTPYETLRPESCPKLPKKKVSLLRKFFCYFFDS